MSTLGKKWSKSILSRVLRILPNIEWLWGRFPSSLRPWEYHKYIYIKIIIYIDKGPPDHATEICLGHDFDIMELLLEIALLWNSSFINPSHSGPVEPVLSLHLLQNRRSAGPRDATSLVIIWLLWLRVDMEITYRVWRLARSSPCLHQSPGELDLQLWHF